MIVLYILFCVAVLFMAGMIGYAISVAQSLKDLSEIQDGLDRLMENHDKFVEAADAAIEECREAVRSTYVELVNLRDNGTEDLDELIGYLGEFMDDHKEN